MENHESCPTDSTPFPESNVTSYNRKDKCHTSSRGHFRNTHQKWDHKDGKNDKNTTGKVKILCYRCGGKNHWSRTCQTPKHLVELYQQSLKDKGKKIKTNFVCENDKDDYDIVGTTHLKVVDFFTTLEGNN
ncbi:hypothetical protein ES332_D04G156100v1 [Gossypium tomentosum]|uniref:CCHC-type domain-containing protein n=1 Tax=Gossypium tomentosum TaxID=34277 RepID=A0A5D2LDN1_GOSTO|nr:hypothetical protein ES332_D04G156100v1 [Gossypium tomentosum]